MGSLLTVLPKPATERTGWPWTQETDPEIYKQDFQYPRVSIITPTYNQGEFIEETIRSILLQNYPNLEYIIMDGGSTDNTVDIIKKYAPWITYWESEKDRGQSHAINKGLERCTGEICNWINSDDCLTANSLNTIRKGFSDPAILCFCGNALVEFDKPGKEPALFRTSLLDQDLNIHLANVSMSQPATFFSMSAFRQITPLEETLHMNMDMYMWYRFVCQFGLERIASTDEIVCTVKAHAEAKTVKSFEKSFVDKQRIFDSLFVNLNTSFKPRSIVLPLEIGQDIRSKINYQKLRKRYCRTHLWRMTFEGKIVGINIRNVLGWLIPS